MSGPEPQHDEPAYGVMTGPAPGAPGAAATRPVSNAVIVHGKPSRAEYYDPDIASSSNHHWLPWLAKQLIVRDIPAHTPEMPHAYAPNYPLWCQEFERFDIGPGTLLVGHSCGAGFLVRWLSEHPRVRVNRVVLVAPWLDPDRVEAADFFDFHIDDGLVSRTAGVTVVNSDDDTTRIQRSARLLLERIQGVAYVEFHGYGHFGVSDLGGIAFPELLALLTQPSAHAVVAAGQSTVG